MGNPNDRGLNQRSWGVPSKEQVAQEKETFQALMSGRVMPESCV
jgi:hypothetical protein